MTEQNFGYAAVLKPNEGVVVTIDGKSFPIPPSAINYKALVAAIRHNANIDVIRELVTPKLALKKLASDNGFEVIIDEKIDAIEVYCDGEKLPKMFDATPLQDKTFEQPPSAAKKIQYVKHTKTGKRYSLVSITKMVEKVGQRQTAKALQIPRSTLQDWLCTRD